MGSIFKDFNFNKSSYNIITLDSNVKDLSNLYDSANKELGNILQAIESTESSFKEKKEKALTDVKSLINRLTNSSRKKDTIYGRDGNGNTISVNGIEVMLKYCNNIIGNITDNKINKDRLNISLEIIKNLVTDLNATTSNKDLIESVVNIHTVFNSTLVNIHNKILDIAIENIANINKCLTTIEKLTDSEINNNIEDYLVMDMLQYFKTAGMLKIDILQDLFNVINLINNAYAIGEKENKVNIDSTIINNFTSLSKLSFNMLKIPEHKHIEIKDKSKANLDIEDNSVTISMPFVYGISLVNAGESTNIKYNILVLYKTSYFYIEDMELILRNT